MVKCELSLGQSLTARLGYFRIPFRITRTICEVCLSMVRGMPSRIHRSTAGQQPIPEDRDVARHFTKGCETDLVSAQEAARRLGVAVSSLYDWLNQSDCGEFVIRGEPVTIDYFQTGGRGQGRIHLENKEVERLKELFRVRPRKYAPRRQPAKHQAYPGITVELGRPPP